MFALLQFSLRRLSKFAGHQWSAPALSCGAALIRQHRVLPGDADHTNGLPEARR
jgi:hypothetical protein